MKLILFPILLCIYAYRAISGCKHRSTVLDFLLSGKHGAEPVRRCLNCGGMFRVAGRFGEKLERVGR